VSTLVLVLFFVVVGLAVVLVAMRSGSSGPLLDPQKRSGRRAVAWLAALAVAVFGIGVPVAVGITTADQSKEAGPIELTAHEERGRQVFNRYCVQCHTLGASNAVQEVGPNLDRLRPPRELILDAIENGRARGQGQMPAQLVTGPDAEAVAAYVVRVAGRD
jgi:mono/diheme cytochrome c family protein